MAWLRAYYQSITYRRRLNCRPLTCIATWILFIVSQPSLAVHPGQWEHTTEADFEAGDTHNTVVTNLGDIKLGSRLNTLVELPGEVGVTYDMVTTSDGTVYIATGPKGRLAIYKDNQSTIISELEEEQIFSLHVDQQDRLIVGVSGNPSRIAVLNKTNNQLETLVDLPSTRYVWDLLEYSNHILAATGTDGKILLIDTTDQNQGGQPDIIELVDTSQSNVLCLGSDAKGQIYAGTDTDGLVYRIKINPDNTAQVFVLYDAPEPEIGTLLVTKDGTIYAGTADANQARPGRLEEASETESGRPEVPITNKQEAKEPGEVPKVPPVPDPVDTGHNSDQDQSGLPKSNAMNDLSAELEKHQHSNIDNANSSHEHPADIDQDHKQATSDDRLRNLVNQLTDTSDSQNAKPEEKSKLVATARASTGGNQHGQRRGVTSGNGQEGNAIYQISPDGYVNEIFRESVMILNLLADPFGRSWLLVATGNEGQIFRVDPDAEETTAVADVDPKQIPAMIRDHEGQILIGTANPAQLIRIKRGYAEQGTYVSDVQEANQTSLWGKLNITANTPPGTSIAIETRTGNVADPDHAPWYQWSNPQTFEHAPESKTLIPRSVVIQSPPARYFQYRLTFTGDLTTTPVVDRVAVTYVVPNLKPVVSSIQTQYNDEGTNGAKSGGGTSEPSHDPILKITWDASDPNQDTLTYHLQYTPADSGVWLTIDDDIIETSYQWQTRRVPDGWYVLRITADDHMDNPPDMAKNTSRRSDPLLIDNSAPSLKIFHQKPQLPDQATLTASIEDKLSIIKQVSYAIDSGDQWMSLLPDDLIYDSTKETFTIKMKDLAPGPHVVVIRAVDMLGNTSYNSAYINQ